MKQNENSDFFENLVENSNMFMNILFLCLLVWYWMLSYEYGCIYHVYNPNLYFLSSFNWQKARILKSVTNPDTLAKKQNKTIMNHMYFVHTDRSDFYAAPTAIIAVYSIIPYISIIECLESIQIVII